MSQSIQNREPDNYTTHLKTIVMVVVVVAIAALVFGFTFVARDIIALVFIAYLISVAVRNIVNPMQRKLKWPRALCAVIVYVVVILLISGLIASIIPSLVTQLTEFINQFDLNELSTVVADIGFELSDINSFIQEISKLGQPLISGIGSVFGQVVNFFTMAIISFHFVMSQGKTTQQIEKLTRNPILAKSLQGFSDLLKKQLGGWIQGELLLMLIVGLASYLGFFLIGIPYAVPLAIFCGLLELMPTLGPIISAVPAAIIGFTVSPLTGILAIAICIVIQQLENAFLVPRIMNKSANINPIVSIIAILIGFKFLGVMGAIMSLPIFIIIRCIYLYFIRDLHYHDLLTSPPPLTESTT